MNQSDAKYKIGGGFAFLNAPFASHPNDDCAPERQSMRCAPMASTGIRYASSFGLTSRSRIAGSTLENGRWRASRSDWMSGYTNRRRSRVRISKENR